MRLHPTRGTEVLNVMSYRRKVPFSTWQSHLAERTKLDEPVTIKIRSRAECESLLNEAGFKVADYSKRGFTQNNIPILGKMLSPSVWFLQEEGRAELRRGQVQQRGPPARPAWHEDKERKQIPKGLNLRSHAELDIR